MIKYIITGTGRCGTGYMAHMFNKYVGACGHEHIYAPTVSDIETRLATMPLIAESSWLAVPHLQSLLDQGVRVIHIVRHPLDVMTSFIDRDFYKNLRTEPKCVYSQYVANLVPEIENPCEVEASMHHYIKWNNMILKYSGHELYVRVRLEDMPAVFFLLMQLPANAQQQDTEPKNIGRKQTPRIKWDDIKHIPIAAELKSMADMFNYTL